MVVGNHQCNAANLNQIKAQFQLELSLAISKYHPNDIQVLLKTMSINCQNIEQITPKYCQNIIQILFPP